MKEFIYFFKHKGVDAVKIGKTSGESVNSRFQQFKTYSPFGAEVIGFFECKNAISIEKELHKKFSHCRIKGEWFEISREACQCIIDEYDNTHEKVKKIFNEWISDPENDVEALMRILKKSPSINEKAVSKEYELIIENFSMPTGDCEQLTATEIKNKLEEKYKISLSIRLIGQSLNKIGYQGRHVKVGGTTKRVYAISSVC